ncbi:DUF4262 domain-containing protein [Streptomyces acidiscabies]|uniref:DUF4262 domain-containing protein n=1 Tax=Streptomyces acidiscabies TaxID=42234 RepID=UPI0038F6F76B
MPNDCHGIVCDDVTGLEPRPRWTVGTIRRHGFQVTMVPADEHGPGWASTIGLWHGRRVPEPAMFGLDVHLMHTILDDLGRRAVDGQTVAAGQERHDVASVPVALQAVDHRWYQAFFGTAIGCYRKPPSPFLQVVRPDRDGVFP